MYIYFFVFLLIIILYPIYQRKYKKMYLVLILGVITLLFCLRDFSVGTDTRNYIDIYNNNIAENINYIKKEFPSKSLLFSEPLFFLYCSFLQELGIDGRGFIVVTSIFMIGSMLQFIKKHSDNYLISLFTFVTLGVMPMMLSALRQSIALAIIFYAYTFLFERKSIQYFSLVFLAAGFHVSAYIMIPAYFILPIFRKRKSSIVFLVSTIAGFFGVSFFSIIISKLELGKRFVGYLDNNVVRTNPLLIILYLAIGLVYIFLNWGYYGEGKKNSTINHYMFILYMVGVSIIIVSLQNTIISRFAVYYTLGMPILLGNVINRIGKARYRALITLMCICIEGMFFFYTTPSSVYGIANYAFGF